MKRIPEKGGWECDAFSRRARRIILSFTRPGVARRAKKSYRRRFRLHEKAEAKAQRMEREDG